VHRARYAHTQTCRCVGTCCTMRALTLTVHVHVSCAPPLAPLCVSDARLPVGACCACRSRLAALAGAWCVTSLLPALSSHYEFTAWRAQATATGSGHMRWHPAPCMRVSTTHSRRTRLRACGGVRPACACRSATATHHALPLSQHAHLLIRCHHAAGRGRGAGGARAAAVDATSAGVARAAQHAGAPT
jgi:hypothetical protein